MPEGYREPAATANSNHQMKHKGGVGNAGVDGSGITKYNFGRSVGWRHPNCKYRHVTLIIRMLRLGHFYQVIIKA